MGRRSKSQVLGRLAWWRIRTRKESRGQANVSQRQSLTVWSSGSQVFPANMARVCQLDRFQNHLGNKSAGTPGSLWLWLWQITLIRWEAMQTQSNKTGKLVVGNGLRLIHVKASPCMGERKKAPSATILPTSLSDLSKTPVWWLLLCVRFGLGMVPRWLNTCLIWD